MDPLPDGLSRADVVRAVDHVIRHRRTRKILDGPVLEDAHALVVPDPGDDRFAAALRDAIAVAGFAPFHYPAPGEVPEPWRFTVLMRPAIDAFVAELGEAIAGKLPAILAATGALVHATWLPGATPEKPHIDAENAAAAAAAVQNLLLAVEARGLGSYWCTAKFLATPEALRASGVPDGERYLGSIMVGRKLTPEREVEEGISGKMHAKRTPPEAWTRWR